MYLSNLAQYIALTIELIIAGIGVLWLISFFIWNKIFGNEFSIKKINDHYFKEFFNSLDQKLKQEFINWFVYEPGKKTGVERILFVNNENNAPFFKDFVRFSSHYKDKISLDLIYKMFEFAKSNYYDQKSYNYIINKEIKLFYSLRHDPLASKYCKDLCYQKLGDFSNLEENSIYLKYLINLESIDNIKKAIELCNIAIEKNIGDGTKGGYENKLKKLQKTANIQHNSIPEIKTADQ
ncbi:MAG TPA: hypothetical protein VIL26_02670 [Clostridia bacterium]